jgi:hypothetical protein
VLDCLASPTTSSSSVLFMRARITIMLRVAHR